MSNIVAIGLTGGIASGKSFVSDQLGALGAQVIDTDILAREVLSPGTAGLQEVCAQFGASVLQADGSLDRKRLREIVFNDPSARKTLEAITHPRIRASVIARWQSLSMASGPYALIVVPLMAEGGRYDFLQQVIVVDCLPQTQLQRLMQRDGIEQALAQKMLDAQASRGSRLKLADHVLSNDLDRRALEPHIVWLHHTFLSTALRAT